jgi:hypothetical protein
MDGNAKQLKNNANGTYTISTAGDATHIEFDGKGTQIGNDGSGKVEMKILVRVPPLNDSLYVVN